MKIACKFAYRLSNLSEITTVAGSLYCKTNIMINDGLLVFWFIIIRHQYLKVTETLPVHTQINVGLNMILMYIHVYKVFWKLNI